jgi:fibronectin-binding autotransporter adhesin
MRPAYSRGLTLCITVLCLLAAVCSFDGVASAQAAPRTKRKLSQQSLLSQGPMASVASAQKLNAPPAGTTDTWTGGGSNSNWSNASNWNNGAITTGENIVVNLTTAATIDDQSFTIGTLTLSNATDSVTINPGAALTVGGNIANNGTITLGTVSSGAEMVLNGNVTLSGSGTLTLSNNSNNFIFANAALDQLTNQQTIQGAGQIGDGQMTLVNSGTINANQSANSLTIDANDGFTNTGTVEATSGATLILQNMGTVNNTGGKILANTGTVQLNNSTIQGGTVTLTGASTLQLNSSTLVGETLTNSATGTIEAVSGSNVLGGTINNSAGGLFEINNGAVLNLQGGTYSQLGKVQLNSTGSFAELVLQGNVTLSGGSVTLSNNTTNYIFGQVGADTLTNQETISGAGQIGNGTMTLVNSGTINANQSAGMTINANGGMTNTGTVETTAGATLLFQSTRINNTGGTITANTGTLQLNSSMINGGNVTLVGASTLQLNSSNIHGGTITNSATGTIDLASGTTLLGGTINNSAGGLFEINNGAVLDLEGGIYSQLGTVQLNSTGFSELVLQGNVTLSGGSVTLSNNSSNYIFGQVGADTLTNQETISGAGQIGNGTMTLVNSGTINANQSAGMTISANGGMTNTGTVEATAGATLLFQNTRINNTGGTITANTGTLQVNSSMINGGNVTLVGASTLQLNTSNIHGGTITNSATGTIDLASGTTLLGGTINNSAGGLFEISNGAILDLEGGAYSQLGTVQLNSTGSFSELVLEGNVTLSGGSLTLSNNSTNYIFGAVATDTLTNQETISGAGQIGNGTMALVNSGTINANQSAGMTISANDGMTNTGTVEATAGATLAFNSTIMNNTGGKINANTGTLQLNSSSITGGTVTLVGASNLQLNTSTIHGGTITNSATGAITVASGTNVLGGTINNSAGGVLAISNGAILDLEGGTYSQLGTVQLNSTGSFSELVLQGNVTLSGGTLTLSNNSTNYIFGAVATDTLTNQETISGAGQIGNGTMTLVNSGTINASQSAGMTISANDGMTNTGTVEATGGATLVFNSTIVNNTGGTINANTGTLQLNSSSINGGNVTLVGASNLQLNTSTIHGGSTITNSATGTITVASGTNVLGGAINNSAGGVLAISNGAILQLEGGTYSQLGTVQLNSTGNFTELTLVGNATLSGGTLTMSANANNYILAAVATDILTNQETIQGAGQIGNGGMGLVNSGTINANASGNIVINVSNMNFSNTGTIEASGATLTIQGPGVTFFTNDNQSTNTLTGGTYIANGANIQWNAGTGGITTLAANVTEESGGQLFNTTNSTNALAGLTSITSTGALTIGGVAFTDAGAFSNAGSLTILGGESFTVGSLSQISGGSLTAGTYVLGANLNLSGTPQTITTNAATLTLAGGTIENTSNSTNALAGLATNSGKLTIAGGSNNVSTTAASFSNTGTLTINSGDSFTASKLTQISGTTLSGGTFVLTGNLDLTTTGISVTTNSSTLTLAGGTIKSGSSNALSALASNTKSLTIAGTSNNVSTSAASFSNAGTLTINAGDSFTASKLTQISGTTLSAGTYVLGGNLNLTTSGISIATNAANLTLQGGTINSNGSNALSAFNNNTGTLALGGTAAVTTASGNFSNSGTVTVAKGTTLTVGGTGNSYNQTAGTTTVDGTLSGGTSGAVNVTGGKILGAGTVQANTSVGNASGAAGTINVGDTGKSGLLAITGTYTQLATGNMTGLINGATAGTGFSQINITGTAALAGTINFTVATAFQSSLTSGETFTVLNASSVTGTFSNSTIAINSSFHFVVSYTSTGVVLTVQAGPVAPPNASPAQVTAQVAMVNPKLAPTTITTTTKSKTLVLVSGSRHSASGAGKSARPIVVASLPQRTGHSDIVLARGPNVIMTSGLRSWERTPVVSAVQARPLVAVAQGPRAVNAASSYATLPASDLRMGQSRAIRLQAPLAGWIGASGNRRVPVKIMQPLLPRLTR